MPQLSTNLPWELARAQWPATLNPVIAAPILQGKQVQVNLQTGVNQVVHGLKKLPQGWFIVDTDESIQVFRSAPFNTSTLILTSSAPANVAIWIY